VGEGDDHILFDDEIFVRNTINRVDNNRPSRITPTTTSRILASLASKSFKSAILALNSSSSSMTFCRSMAVSERRRISRIA
jgi:hypothetical protein